MLEHNGDSAWDRVPESATAFGHRTWPYNFVVTSAWSDPKDAERNIAWTRELFDAMRPFAAQGAYVNYLGGDEGDRWAQGCVRREARAARRAEGEVRPDEPVPDEPEHRAHLTRRHGLRQFEWYHYGLMINDDCFFFLLRFFLRHEKGKGLLHEAGEKGDVERSRIALADLKSHGESELC